MTKRMLIDSSHPEETRVVIIEGNKLDDFEVETSTRKQIKGNIYLAKVIRVEPSLQAAFLDYGGGKHGFLPFNEIHPDYYKIPVADRDETADQEEDEITDTKQNDLKEDPKSDEVSKEDKVEEPAENKEEIKEETTKEDDEVEKQKITVDAEAIVTEKEECEENSKSDVVTVSDYEDVLDIDEEDVASKSLLFKKYKIQEVIKRNQIMLVEVTKEERGNKGVALTTYLSLPGRYCVLMPNSGREGGVSRKITSSTDRKRLKTIIKELPTTDDMAIIVRTAGKDRNKAEITRDYDYLIKMWNKIRAETLKSKAPALIYEEGNLIKRTIRDLYTKDIDEILVEGDAGYRTAKDFMKTITPSHARKVKQYKETEISLFQRYQIENQLESLHSPIVQLDSGSYLVINQTEALVAIDVNSGRATKERNIEDTALNTNLEAADEIARQLRLRNLAGLVVIDFIDMEEVANNHAVERRMKEALKRDRARIQVGRISGFGLMEISRQRIHSSFLEASYTVCPHCSGKGLIRTIESSSIFMLRMIEEEALRRRACKIIMSVPVEVAIYILNYKRKNINILEQRYGIDIVISGDVNLLAATDYRMDLEKIAVENNQEVSEEDNNSKKKEENSHRNNKKESNKPRNNKNYKNNKKKNFNKNKKPEIKENNSLTENVKVEQETEETKDVKNQKPEEKNSQEDQKKTDYKKSKRTGLRNLRKRHNSKYKDKKNFSNNKKAKPEDKKTTSSEASVVVFDSHPKKKDKDIKKEKPKEKVVANNSNIGEENITPKKGWWQKLMS